MEKRSIRWHGPEPEYMRGKRFSEEETEVPEGCKMPSDVAAQIYELRRMFRL